MRPVDVNLKAIGFSPWVPLDYLQNGFSVGLGFSVSAGASLTAQVEHTFDDLLQNNHPVQITQATTVITVVDTGFTQQFSGADSAGGHNLSVGDSVQIEGSRVLGMDGLFSVVTVPNNTSYTLTSLVSQSATADSGVQAASARVHPHATLINLVARADGNYAFPPMAVRLRLSAYASGIASLMIRQGMGSR